MSQRKLWLYLHALSLEQGTPTMIQLNQNASVNMPGEININCGMKMPFIPAKQ